eukprot:m.119232 g.119232  ORF g.119232 m.119232 type:complete len:615 (+) comp15465_c0_seq2:97-1941(+)
MMDADQKEVVDFLGTAKAYTTFYLGSYHYYTQPQPIAELYPSSTDGAEDAADINTLRRESIDVGAFARRRSSTTQQQQLPLRQAFDERMQQLTDQDIRRITTHSAHIFLVGQVLAYKLEKLVKFPFMDLSTLALRKETTRKELCLNRTTSPEIYLGLVAVCKAKDGQLYLAPINENPSKGDVLYLTEDRYRQQVGQDSLDIVEYLVEMRQFAQDDMLDALARRGELTKTIMEDVVEQVVLFHHNAQMYVDLQYGSSAMLWIASDNLKEMCEFGAEHKIDKEKAASICQECLAATEDKSAVLNMRATQGKVRFCHGDLHLRNMVLLEDRRPRLFDCIAFNDKLAIGDVMYDLSFLLMDLLHRDLRNLACITLNKYIQSTHDIEGLQLLPMFLANRAIIRSKVACAEMASHAEEPDQLSRLEHRADSYLDLAHELLCIKSAQICIAIGGFSGSGKSAVARLLACELEGTLGGIILRSDVVRKHMWNVGVLDRLPAEAYSEENRLKCYTEMARLAQQVVSFGFPVILDATFTTEEQRDILATIPECKAFWLDVDLETRAKRVQGRDALNKDASDMTLDKLRSQAGTAPPKEHWTYVDASADVQTVVAIISDQLKTTA